MGVRSLVQGVAMAATGGRLTSSKTHFKLRALRDALPYSEYAYGLYWAADLAKRLGISRISALEFGVAGGNGLLAMERHSAEIKQILGVQIDCYGFDSGAGLTPPQGYRDMPYTFKTGNYKMDLPKLQARIRHSELIIGLVEETTKTFLSKYDPAPIGFSAFDLDYYTPTVDAFGIFSGTEDQKYFLPRIFMHMDDVIGDEISLHNEFVGELLALSEFNDANPAVKMAQNRSLRKYPFNIEWHHQSYVMHRFEHPLYNQYISRHGEANNSLVD